MNAVEQKRMQDLIASNVGLQCMLVAIMQHHNIETFSIDGEELLATKFSNRLKVEQCPLSGYWNIKLMTEREVYDA